MFLQLIIMGELDTEGSFPLELAQQTMITLKCKLVCYTVQDTEK